ncbi:hypothetical protein VNO78_23322 [Psophocarpus tetragonolobus]|uniref:Uncharacterized protein n=1 Tax=Psophocarpus tetragonolobus TaxID=3891 RepID=A0AAN9S4A2_PSOTE
MAFSSDLVHVMDMLQSSSFRQFGKGYNGKFWAAIGFNFVASVSFTMKEEKIWHSQIYRIKLEHTQFTV